jgi:hypothetical protein
MKLFHLQDGSLNQFKTNYVREAQAASAHPLTRGPSTGPINGHIVYNAIGLKRSTSGLAFEDMDIQ